MIEWLAAFADVPKGRVDAAASFWTAAAGCTAGTPHGDRGEFVPLAAAGEDPYLWLQRVDRTDGAGGWHLDLFVDDLESAVETVTALGAGTLRTVPGLVTLTSPAGLPFCLVRSEGERQRAGPRCWPAGHCSLLDQVCLDLPAAVYDDEADFWSAATGWTRRHGTLAEYNRLDRPLRVPLRLLLQRLGADDTGPARAHVDFACDDVAAERRRHESLGATIVRIAEHWSTLRDPSGLLYCITDRDPSAG